MILVDDGDVGSDPRILIKNGSLHRRTWTHPDGNTTTFLQDGTLITGLKEVSTHQQSVLKNHITFDAATDAKNAVMNAAGFENGAFSNNRVGDLGVDQLARGEITGTGVNRELLVVETEGRCWLLGESHVGLIERADGADVLPVIIKDVALELVTTLEGFRNDFLTEILVSRIGVEQIEQGVSAEDINAHGGQVRPLLR